MSGIYGVYHFDGAPADPQWLERMRAAMAYYGPNGGSNRIEGSVGLGHLLLAINPEDAFERQPVAVERGLVVCAARLDNRPALLEAFHLGGEEAARLSDGDLAAMAFDRWGEAVCAYLQGDWALAAWDRQTRKLLLALNACGNETLYFHQGKGYIAFASSLKALLALPGVVKEPEPLRLAQVLVSWQHDAELTAYKGFRRILWAHAMTVDPGGAMRSWSHWSPQGRELLRYRRDEEYVEAFLEHYSRAVQCCLRSQKPIAAMLSGGCDSGSVVAMAAPLLAAQGRGLTAYTSVPYFPPDGAGAQRQGNEWELAHEAASMSGENLRHLPIDAANYPVLEGIEHFIQVHDGPSHAASNHFWLKAIAERGAEDGVGAVLSGGFGNATVSWSGNGSMLLALFQGHPELALQLLMHGEADLWSTVKRQFLRPVAQPVRRVVERWRSPSSRPWREYSALNPHMADELDVDGRMRVARFDPTYNFPPQEDMRQRFFHPMWGISMGMLSETGARHEMAFLDPTLNISLIEFLLRVPDSQFRHRGQGSVLFRRAFCGRLPDRVLAGRQRGLQSADIGHRLRQELPAIRTCLDALEALPVARNFLDLPLLRCCVDELAARVDPHSSGRACTILLRGIGVGQFLRRLG
jgi:asparagine synthase (glutamine-hydrolysing)